MPSSVYRLPGGAEVLVMTAADRSWTCALLPDEYTTREVGTREGYARWAAAYARGPNPLIAVEEPRAAALLSGLAMARGSEGDPHAPH